MSSSVLDPAFNWLAISFVIFVDRRIATESPGNSTPCQKGSEHGDDDSEKLLTERGSTVTQSGSEDIQTCQHQKTCTKTRKLTHRATALSRNHSPIRRYYPSVLEIKLSGQRLQVPATTHVWCHPARLDETKYLLNCSPVYDIIAQPDTGHVLLQWQSSEFLDKLS
jgi:hypothetical protein